ncbi:hypothetical protein [Streptomyces sp. NPDC058757]|uniref:hypothetical protein n=1 Tax=unclassified Streptomyces TaxID=2593676 RepID=UPI0036C12760
MTEGPYASFDVFVDAPDPQTVAGRLRTALGGVEGPVTARHDLIVGPLWMTGVDNGPRTGDRADPYDFLRWPAVLEGETSLRATPAEVVEAVATVLRALWSMGYRAAVRCGFEDELPDAGGRTRYR